MQRQPWCRDFRSSAIEHKLRVKARLLMERWHRGVAALLKLTPCSKAKPWCMDLQQFCFHEEGSHTVPYAVGGPLKLFNERYQRTIEQAAWH